MLRFLQTGVIMTAMSFVLFASEPFPVINDFQLDRYLGTWHEIARLDHSFERGLSNVTATYSLKDGGGVLVHNRGYKDSKERWEDARGSAKFAETENIGRLKVTFFWPFYGGYNIMSLDPDYQVALIAGDSHKYLWILAREPVLPDSTLQPLLELARQQGFDTQKLIWIDQSKNY
jgi:apolipoprotein D and lipocalin family protein